MTDGKGYWEKQSTTNKVIIIAVIIVGIGAVFPPVQTNWWTDTITGQITGAITKPIYDGISQNAVTTLACIDQKTGSVAVYSPFDAQTGKIKC